METSEQKRLRLSKELAVMEHGSFRVVTLNGQPEAVSISQAKEIESPNALILADPSP